MLKLSQRIGKIQCYRIAQTICVDTIEENQILYRSPTAGIVALREYLHYNLQASAWVACIHKGRASYIPLPPAMLLEALSCKSFYTLVCLRCYFDFL